MVVEETLNKLRKRIGNSIFDSLLQSSGLKSVIVPVYWKAFLSIHPGIEEICVNQHCSKFYVRNRFDYYQLNDNLESNQINTILNRVGEKDVFYDIGANIGIYSCIISQALTEGTVIAFEPHPRNVERLTENIKLNNKEIRVMEYALSKSSGTAELSLDSDSKYRSGGGKHSLNKENDSETIEVQKRCGNQIIAEKSIPDPTVVKIDVEGAEYDVISGIRNYLESDECRLIFCEIHNKKINEFGHEAQDVINLLSDLGFNTEKISQRSTQSFIIGEK